jgi:hypothetical protein
MRFDRVIFARVLFDGMLFAGNRLRTVVFWFVLAFVLILLMVRFYSGLLVFLMTIAQGVIPLERLPMISVKLRQHQLLTRVQLVGFVKVVAANDLMAVSVDVALRSVLVMFVQLIASDAVDAFALSDFVYTLDSMTMLVDEVHGLCVSVGTMVCVMVNASA